MHGGHSSDASSASAPAVPPARALGTVIFLGVTAGIQMSDRGLQSILSPAIKAHFAVGDAVMGALHGIAGILIASALAVPLARLADSYSRKHILLGLIATWGVLTAIGALAPNFPLFFIGRAAAGITEFAMIPIVYSLIPDLVGERRRVGANLLFAALMATGSAAGFYLGGNLLDFVITSGFPAPILPLKSWRAAMLLLGLASIPLFLVGLATADPPRGARIAEGQGSVTLGAFLRSRAREILLFLGAAGGISIAVQAVIPMIAMAITRRFTVDLAEVGHALGLITLVTSLGSLPLAGFFDRALRNSAGERARPIIMAIATLLALPCAALIGAMTDETNALTLTAAFILLTCVASALIPTMLQDLLPVELRARGFATYSFVIAAFCAIGPVLSGTMSDYLLNQDLLSAISYASVPPLVVAFACAMTSGRRARGGMHPYP